MMPELIQDGTVTLIAIAAAATILRRVIGVVRPSKTAGAACSSCASRCPAPLAGGQPASPAEPVPVQLLRRPEHEARSRATTG